MQVTSLELKNFRCFAQRTIEFDSPLVLIEGSNGSGKTSILEALHYLCYVRSFRTHLPGTLVRQGDNSFFLKATFTENDSLLAHELQIGLCGKRRSVKLNQRPVASYKELMDHYRVVTLTEDDLGFIKGGPDGRRSFIDQAIMLQSCSYAKLVLEARKIVDQRTSLLQRGKYSAELYRLWTLQLWEKTKQIQLMRKEMLAAFEKSINKMLADIFGQSPGFSLRYAPKKNADFASGEEFIERYPTLEHDEQMYGYSLFGPHLDDIHILLQEAASRLFASRGQQKLLVLLLKIAHMLELKKQKGKAILLIDDFMTDFDSERAEKCLSLLTALDCQLIFTSPVGFGALSEHIVRLGGKRVCLT